VALTSRGPSSSPPGSIDVNRTTALQSYKPPRVRLKRSPASFGHRLLYSQWEHRGLGRKTIFTAANTYSGVTDVSRGTLLVNNAILTDSGTGSSTVTVGGNGKLGGSGSIDGPVPALPISALSRLGETSPAYCCQAHRQGRPDTRRCSCSDGGPGAVLNFEVERPARPSAPAIDRFHASNGLTINGGTVNITDLGVAWGNYKLIDYVGAVQGPAVLRWPLRRHRDSPGPLFNNTAPGNEWIELQVTTAVARRTRRLQTATAPSMRPTMYCGERAFR